MFEFENILDIFLGNTPVISDCVACKPAYVFFSEPRKVLEKHVFSFMGSF